MALPFEVVLDQARAQLTRQEAKLDQLRTIAGTVLSVAGVIAGFVAPSVTTRHPWYAVPPIVSFAVCVTLGIFVLVPRRDLKFSENLESYTTWVDKYGEEPGSEVSFALGLAKNLERSRVDNAKIVEPLAKLLKWQILALGIEVVLWAAALAIA